MSHDSFILGTVVPDNVIHRASLWVEELKYDGGARELRVMDADTMRRFCSDVGRFSPGELHEATSFYAANLTMMVFGDLNLAVSGQLGTLRARDIVGSAWLDGFMHGAGAGLGRRGLSVAEALKLGDA